MFECVDFHLEGQKVKILIASILCSVALIIVDSIMLAFLLLFLLKKVLQLLTDTTPKH